jgi:hypothetical protein
MQLTKFKTVRTLALAGVLIIAGGWLRPAPSDSGLFEYQFKALKVLGDARYDMVLVGNSRVEQGVSPAAMAAELPGWRIMNLGMAGCGLDAAYLTAARGMLDPESAMPTIAIGVSPGALCESAVLDNAFLALQRAHPVELWLTYRFGTLAGFWRPYNLADLRYAITRSGPRHYRHYYADGWQASRIEPPPDSTAKLENYRELFSYDKVSPEMTAELLELVRDWSAAGITVIGFRPPAGEQMVALEDELSGFDEQ